MRQERSKHRGSGSKCGRNIRKTKKSGEAHSQLTPLHEQGGVGVLANAQPGSRRIVEPGRLERIGRVRQSSVEHLRVPELS